ncbi:ferritin-like domain-containing protein [Roseateles sp. DAIF2]|uniref:ferritin-like domain-containing protein n=1 Tax=Roseateles sp. DAIF2 TaxID=2714952 RepID=UPI0018A3219B|nr:ferritin-like domain-containing protein [Roseateles sp. DAIF2]
MNAPPRQQDLQDDPSHLRLDSHAIEEARLCPDPPRGMPLQAGAWREDLIRLLNDALATELVCALRYKRHHFTAHGLASPKIAEEFLAHAQVEIVHADRLARRIVQLGGVPDFSPDTLSRRSHALYDASLDLRAMLGANLVAERVAIEIYSQLITLIGGKDASTRRLLEDILAEEQQHADELKGWLAD